MHNSFLSCPVTSLDLKGWQGSGFRPHPGNHVTFWKYADGDKGLKTIIGRSGNQRCCRYELQKQLFFFLNFMGRRQEEKGLAKKLSFSYLVQRLFGLQLLLLSAAYFEVI